jgi:hypothetical protein
MKTLNSSLRYLGPHVTVCNYFTYMWTFIADHFSEEDATGTAQRVQIKSAPIAQENSLANFGAVRPAKGGTIDPVQQAALGDAAALHQSDYPRAVAENGEADCESGQRGYPGDGIFTNHRTPGNQGPTFKGRPRVPAGQSFSAEPTGIAPSVLP